MNEPWHPGSIEIDPSQDLNETIADQFLSTRSINCVTVGMAMERDKLLFRAMVCCDIADDAIRSAMNA